MRAMSPSPDDKLIDDAVQDFSQAVHADLPLRHFGEFHDPDRLKDVVELQKKNVFGKLFDKIWTRDRDDIAALFKKVNRRMHKEVIVAWMKKNQEHEIQSVSFLQKWVDMLCEDFNVALEAQLLLNPDMDLDSLKNYIKSRKLVEISCFDGIWKPYNAKMQEERKSKLEKHLKAKEEEMLDQQELHLHRKLFEGRKSLLREVTSILLERSRQLKCYVDKHQGKVPSDVLNGMVEEIREYLLNGKGSSLKESHQNIHTMLVETVEEGVTFLNEGSREEMTTDYVGGFAVRFDEKLRSCCYDDVGEAHTAQETQEDKNECDSVEQSRRWVAMQDIFNDIKEEPLEPMDVDANAPNSSTNESRAEGNNDGGSVSVKGPEQTATQKKASTEENRMSQCSSRRRRLKRLVRNMDSDPTDHTRGSSVPEVPTFGTLNTGCNVTNKIRRRPESDVQRRSTRLNKAATSNSVPSTTFPKCGSSRTDTGKSSIDLDPTKKQKWDAHTKERSPHLHWHDDKTEGDSLISTDALEPPPSLRRNRERKGNGVSLKSPQHNSNSSRLAVSKTTRRASARNGTPSPSSDRPQLCSMDSKESKRCRGDSAGKPRGRPRPKNITILKGDDHKYFCNVCEAKFKWRHYLKYHGEFCGKRKLQFICDECGKGFHSRHHLDSHVRTHTGEKPFECPQCSMRFAVKGNMSRHIRCHVNEKCYSCKPCKMSFVSPQALHDHNLTHEGKFPFPCGYCDKRFDCMAVLKNHVVLHGGERPFRCPQCGVAFARRGYLIQHSEQTHNQSRKTAHQLVYEASVAYLLEETNDESNCDIPAHKINAVVLNHVIKKKNLQLPNAS